MSSNSTNICKNVLYPSRILSYYFKAYWLWLTSPIINKLSKISHFSSYRWNSKCGKHIIICIPSHFVSDNFIRISFHWSFWEVGMIRNIFKNCQISWRSCFNIIWFSTIVRPYKIISWSVTIYYEFELFLILWYKISHCYCFRFRKRLITWPKITTKFCLIFLSFRCPVNSIISI